MSFFSNCFVRLLLLPSVSPPDHANCPVASSCFGFRLRPSSLASTLSSLLPRRSHRKFCAYTPHRPRLNNKNPETKATRLVSPRPSQQLDVASFGGGFPFLSVKQSFSPAGNPCKAVA
ncbi:hypothetical protein IWX90DRAFT_140409 [Phyllosticta citrichinensis]|uniref:Secreted protein n=1 Tax=Phyllosticta citrichinensis TaxID=1130410 RepID=A0ABR1XYN1_9PEZI